LSGKPPAVALFCATYLKPEMLHIYRHITGLKTYRPVVIAQKLEGDWAIQDLHVIPRSALRFLSRGLEKSTGKPWQISKGEAARILDVIREEGCSLLHVFFGNIAVHLLPLLKACPVPVVVSFHGSDVAGSMASATYRATIREIFHHAAIVPCRSEQLAGQVEKLGCPPEKLRLMRTILPDISFTPRKAPVDGAWRIVQAARLVPKKGLVTALRAFAAFAGKHPFSTLTIAGEGPMEEELRKLVFESNLDNRVEFAGFLPQESLQGLFATSHIFLHPSETAGGDAEGIPNAMLEAMASGMAVVATRHGGIPEVIRDGENGLLCAERDVVGIAEALVRLATEPDLFATLGKRASASVKELFSAARQISAIESLYAEAVETR